jgi:thymidylate synthase (FAD)
MTPVVQEPVLPETVVPVLDKGFVALDGALASDLAVVNGARVSFNQESDELSERDEGLIRFLIRERHGSPFEHGYFRFLVKAPIFVVREHHRHRAGHSYNEWSGRYSKMEPEFYVPENVRTQVGKPGAYSFEPVDEATREAARREIEENGARAFQAYERMLEQGVAKEVARAVLPLGTYTKYYWSCNPRSLMHFCGLRNH